MFPLIKNIPSHSHYVPENYPPANFFLNILKLCLEGKLNGSVIHLLVISNYFYWTDYRPAILKEICTVKRMF